MQGEQTHFVEFYDNLSRENRKVLCWLLKVYQDDFQKPMALCEIKAPSFRQIIVPVNCVTCRHTGTPLVWGFLPPVEENIGLPISLVFADQHKAMLLTSDENVVAAWHALPDHPFAEFCLFAVAAYVQTPAGLQHWKAARVASYKAATETQGVRSEDL